LFPAVVPKAEDNASVENVVFCALLQENKNKDMAKAYSDFFMTN
jgi:hypothetical protein